MSTKVENALLSLTKDVGQLIGEMKANTANQAGINENLAKLLEKQADRDDEIEAKADIAISRLDAASNKAWGIGIGSALGGGGFGAFLMKLFH
jgi:hypothetical protein